MKDQIPVGRRIVHLKKIICPLLNLMASKDDLVPCAQSEPLNALVGSSDKTIMKLPSGHIGLAVGSRAQKELGQASPNGCPIALKRLDWRSK